MEGPAAHQAVEEDGGEGRTAGELEAHHDHARDPEEQDVVPRFHDAGRVEARQVRGRLVRPAER